MKPKTTLLLGIGLEHLSYLYKQYDTILADYLIGVMGGFSPFKQDQMIPKLVQFLKPGGKLYVVGLKPIPEKVEEPANIICEVQRVCDA